MRIESTDKNIQQLFKMGYLKVPRFQRPYSWEKGEIEDFWNDTVVSNERDYFIGSIVVFTGSDDDVFGIVDGQQRLTTITMLLCAIRNALAKEKFPKLANGLHGLIERPDINDELQYVLQTETSYPFLQQRIQKFEPTNEKCEVGEEELRLEEGFKYLSEQVSDVVASVKSNPALSEMQKRVAVEEELTTIRDNILQLKVILVILQNEEDAYTIFETLNTRGRDLTVSDLVRTHLTRLLPKPNKNVDLAKERYNAIIADFEASEADIRMNQFLHHLWLSQYEYTTEKKLYKAIRRQIKSKEAAKSFLGALEDDGEIYRHIHEPDSRKWANEEREVRDALSALNLFRVRQQLPFILAVLHAYDQKELNLKHTRRAICAVEHFHLVFTAVTSQRSSGGISFMYALHARELRNAKTLENRIKVIDELLKKLKTKRPEYQEFEANFRTLLCSEKFTKRKPLVQYVLNRFAQKFGGVTTEAKGMTVEHLANQNGSGYKDEEVAEIGNLIWVSEKLNGELGNKPFAEKLRILQESSVWVDSFLKKQSRWTPTEIRKRSDFLAKTAYDKVWNL
jgi:uncharacterized protein with ParB-like and HNH nuclease domain